MGSEDIARENMNTARRIIGMLGISKDEMLSGLKAACADCDKWGPQEGKPCMSLRLALDCGCEYTPPEWCKDTSVDPQ